MTLAKLHDRVAIAAALGWFVPHQPSAATLRAIWFDALATLYRCMTIRSIAELTGLTVYAVQKEMELLGVARRPQGAPMAQNNNKRE